MLMRDHYESVQMFLKHIHASDDEIKNVEARNKVYGNLTWEEFLRLEPMFFLRKEKK